MNIIAADVGGTNTRFVFSDADKPGDILYEAHYSSREFDAFEPLLKRFIDDSGPAGSNVGSLSLALPGVVNESSVRLTNLPWTIEKKALQDRFGIHNIYFMNDFQASASGTRMLSEDDYIIINPGTHKIGATRVVVGAGTGLGVAWIQGANQASCSYSTEGGHIDFAPVDDRQIDLLKFLMRRYEHVSYERLLSGSGLVALYEFCSENENSEIDAKWVNMEAEQGNPDAVSAMTLFVQIYGAYIGNLALVFKPEDGIYITGGIAAKTQKWMISEEFIKSYLNKGRMSTLVNQIGVYLVTNERVGVLGALSEAVKIRQVSGS